MEKNNRKLTKIRMRGVRAFCETTKIVNERRIKLVFYKYYNMLPKLPSAIKDVKKQGFLPIAH